MYDEEDSPRPLLRPVELLLTVAASLCILALVAYAVIGWLLGAGA